MFLVFLKVKIGISSFSKLLISPSTFTIAWV